MCIECSLCRWLTPSSNVQPSIRECRLSTIEQTERWYAKLYRKIMRGSPRGSALSWDTSSKSNSLVRLLVIERILAMVSCPRKISEQAFQVVQLFAAHTSGNGGNSENIGCHFETDFCLRSLSLTLKLATPIVRGGVGHVSGSSWSTRLEIPQILNFPRKR